MARRPDVVIEEMLAATSAILDATRGKTFEEFVGSWLLRHAVQRGIEIISEASRHLPDTLIDKAPEIPWKQVRGIGSVLRHEYHRVSDRLVWNLIVEELPRLSQALERLKSEA